MKNINHFMGCIIGGALGDALGYPIEFSNIQMIKNEFGENGIKSPEIHPYTGSSIITDDTQMTLFTIEGLIRSYTRSNTKGISHVPSVIYHAYLRWLYTQGFFVNRFESSPEEFDGWLIKNQALFAIRAPGNTCLSSLKTGRMGMINDNLNKSKGCGGIMRVAPIGLATKKSFELGCEVAAITHSHQTGFIAAGILAQTISNIIYFDMNIKEAILNSLKISKKYNGYKESFDLVMKAINLANKNTEIKINNELGLGWVAEEALAISTYCALKYSDNFKEGILKAVNHSGDSDSIGSITGNIIGAYLGIESIDTKWIKKLELSNVISEITSDLYSVVTGDVDYLSDEWSNKYPGW